MNPNVLGLPHDAFREGQLEAIQWCDSVEGTSIVEAPTGSGKTSFAAALASKTSVMALCRTKNLQDQNYGKGYRFDILFGKVNYICVHPDAKRGATCADCLYEDNMRKCSLANSCHYLVQKRKCQASPRVSLNYAYYMTAKWAKEQRAAALFLDEAHELHEQVVGFAGCTVTYKNQIDWGLPQFPELRPVMSEGLLIKVQDPRPVAMDWLMGAIGILRQKWVALKRRGDLKKKRRCELLGKKLGRTLEALTLEPNDWFIKSGERAQRFGKELRPAFVCRPLTARHHAPHYFGFNNGQKCILASATIGDFGSFANELGITSFNQLVVPHQYPVEARQVCVLDCPSMGSKAPGSAFEKQADEIAGVIRDCPEEWPGLILVTRKREAKLLAERLAKRGLEDRVWVPPGWEDGSYEPTDKQARAWEERRGRVGNSLCVSWSFWVGYDGLDERILVAAKVPYPLWGSAGSYEASWRKYDMARYKWVTANTLSQGLGRTRRGRPGDYDLNEGFNGFVAIADGSYKGVRKFLPQGLREALVE